jgi:glycogenin glucosyltransferase
VFADEPTPTEPEPSVTDTQNANATLAETSSVDVTEAADSNRQGTPSTPPSNPWASFTRVNAWDDDPRIEKYVDKMPLYRKHRTQASLGQKSPGSVLGENEGAHSQKDTSAGAEWQRRGSKLTDFPTAVERPSLPVTPAPVRRPNFWGDEDEDGHQLPAAPGVPTQSDWVCEHGRIYKPRDCLCDLTNVYRFHKDPVARLQLLAKQQSEMLLQKLGNAGEQDKTKKTVHDIPKRPLPFGSDMVSSPTYVAPTAPLHSPKPVKPLGIGNLNKNTSIEQAASPPAEPSYHGPGAMWEKGEDYLGHSTALEPSEEEKDVLET